MDISEHDPDPVMAILREYENARWMYFVTKPRCEKKLYARLTEQAIPAYLPLAAKLTRYEKRVYRREVPMFPGYVFAATAPQGFRLEQLNAALLKVNFLPDVLAGELLSDLRIVHKMELLTHDRELLIKPELAKGTPVLIRYGVFAGESAIVERRKNTDLVIVNLNSLMMSIRVELPAEWCEMQQDGTRNVSE